MIQKCPQAIAEGILVLAHQSRFAFTDQNRLALVYQNSEHLKTAIISKQRSSQNRWLTKQKLLLRKSQIYGC